GRLFPLIRTTRDRSEQAAADTDDQAGAGKIPVDNHFGGYGRSTQRGFHTRRKFLREFGGRGCGRNRRKCERRNAFFRRESQFYGLGSPRSLSNRDCGSIF